VDLGEPPVNLYVFPVWASGYVAERQRIRERLRRWCELAAQHRGQAAFLGLDLCACVVGDQAAQQFVGVLDIAKVAGAVELVQAGPGQIGQVADVVQPCGGFQQVGFQQVGVRAEGSGDIAGPGGDALNVCPAAGERGLQEFAGQVSGPGGGCLHRPQTRSVSGDVHGHCVPSEDVLWSLAVVSSPDRDI
jgi:hypothetical protein